MFTEYGISVTFWWTKTIQFGQRKLTIPLLAMPGCPLCPVQAYRRMCQLVPAESSSPAFVIPGRTGVSYVTKPQFVQVLRAKLAAAGIKDYQLYRGHSFRRGGTSWAFNVGVPGELIQIFGDWSSDAYKGYLDLSLDSKLLLAERMKASLQEYI